MANLEIAQIKNAALKAAALEVDESGKKDGYIDSSEINLFTDKATALLYEKKCSAQEFAALFATNEVDKTNTTDAFTKVDSLDNAKNTPEALPKEAEEIKLVEKREKISAIEKDIEQKEKKLQELYQIYRKTTPKVGIGDFGAVVAGIGSLSVAPALIKRSAYIGGAITKGITGMLIGGLCGTICTTALITGFAILVKKACQQIFSSKEEKQQFQKADEFYKNEILPLSQEISELKGQLRELRSF